MPKNPLIRQTTVRLPTDLHKRMTSAAQDLDISNDAYIQRAVEHELNQSNPGELIYPQTWGPLMAQRFLECLPTPAVIKDTATREILWCNFAYEDLFNRPRQSLLGKRLEDLGLLEETSASRLRRDINQLLNSKEVKPKIEFWEPLTLVTRGGRVALFRAHRFVFRSNEFNLRCLGDVSFEWEEMQPGVMREPLKDLMQRLRFSAVSDSIGSLFEHFLDECPAAVALKTTASKMVWCNSEYERLSKHKLSSLVGRTTQQIFGLSDGHSTMQGEYSVATANVWMYTIDTLPGKKPRTSLRFPIAGPNGKPTYIGFVSAEFQQGDIYSSNRTGRLQPRKVAK